MSLAPATHTRRAILYGAALGTLPDLDALIPFGGPVENLIFHRSFSHSLMVLSVVAAIVFALARRLDPAVSQSPRRWAALIALSLLTHPILDWFTIYGTQLWWPLDRSAYGLGSIFIIDPLYTLPMLLATIIGWRRAASARRWAVFALTLSTGYLALSAALQWQVQRIAQRSLTAQGVGTDQIVALPTPFNVLLWRVIQREPGGYRVGYYSVLRDATIDDWRFYPSADQSLPALRQLLDTRRLEAFTDGFFAITSCANGAWTISDLRMGMEPAAYVFSYHVAQSDWSGVLASPAGGTVAIPSLRTESAGVLLHWIAARAIGGAQARTGTPSDFMPDSDLCAELR